MQAPSRRAFLGNLGKGTVVAALGPAWSPGLPGGLDGLFGGALDGPLPALPDDLERLAGLMQATAPDALLPLLVDALKGGATLEQLTAAGAIANARAFGGADYEGYHAQMALLPALHMAGAMPAPLRALPVLKVLYRSAARIQTTGRATVVPTEVDPAAVDGAVDDRLRERVRARDLDGAERLFAGACARDVDRACMDLQPLVQDDLNVHRVVLAWRTWDVLGIAGRAHAHELLRQCVRFCVDEERARVDKGRPEPAVRRDLPALFDEFGLHDAAAGTRALDADELSALARQIAFADRRDAAAAAAEALQRGAAPDGVGAAIALAGNLLLLHDPGTRRVHGASVGVHGSDAANAWRHLARLGDAQDRFRALLVGAYHTGGQQQHVGEEPYAFDDQLAALRDRSPAQLLAALQAAIEQNDQRAACAAAHRYGEVDAPPAAVFDLLLGYACSEDGALHAEKYFHTAREEFDATPAALRWRHVTALARVTASEFGEPAPGVAAARRLLEA